jgi:hypothetical protein
MIVVHERRGQLCNQLVLSAYGRALAEQTGQSLVNDALNDYEHLFPATRLNRPGNLVRFFWRKLICRTIRNFHLPVHRIRMKRAETADIVPDNPVLLERLRRHRFTILQGWFNPQQLHLWLSPATRQLYRPDPEVLEEVARTIAQARLRADVLVGLHMRRGDYNLWREGRHFYDFATYARIARDIAALFPGQRTGFILCSNEPIPLEDFAPLAVTPGPGTVLGDLHSLAGCDYIVGPPSTYSLWASLYGLKPCYFLETPEAPRALGDFRLPRRGPGEG